MTDASGPILVPDSTLESAYRRSEIYPKYPTAAQLRDIESSPKYITTPTTVASEESLKGNVYAKQSPPRRWSWRNKWLWSAIIVTVVIAAAVGGALGGTLGLRGDSTSSAESSPAAASLSSSSSSSNSALTTTRTAAVMSGTATPLAKYFYPTAISYGSKVEVLAQGPDQNIYAMYSSTLGSIEDSSSTASLMQLSSAAAPWQHGVAAFVDNSTDETHVFAVFRNGDHYSLYHRFHDYNMTWLPYGGWEPVSSELVSGASAIDWPATTPTSNNAQSWLFAIDTRQQLRALNFTNASSVRDTDWPNIGGTWASYAPSLVSTKRGTIHVFVVYNVTKEVYWGYYDGKSWQPNGPELENLKGYVSSKPTAVSSKPGRLDLFAIGGDGGLWTRQYVTGTKWAEQWDCISGNRTVVGEVEAITWGGNGDEKWIDVFAWAENGALLHKWYDNGAWLPSQDTFDVLSPGPFAGPPKAVEVEDRLHIFAYDGDYALVHVWQQGDGRWTSNTKFGQETLGRMPHP